MRSLHIISRLAPDGRAILSLEGWVEEAGIGLLEREIEQWFEQSRPLTVDLDGVQFIDHTGLELLKTWTARGVGLAGGSLFVRTLLGTYGLN